MSLARAALAARSCAAASGRTLHVSAVDRPAADCKLTWVLHGQSRGGVDGGWWGEKRSVELAVPGQLVGQRRCRQPDVLVSAHVAPPVTLKRVEEREERCGRGRVDEEQRLGVLGLRKIRCPRPPKDELVQGDCIIKYYLSRVSTCRPHVFRGDVGKAEPSTSGGRNLSAFTAVYSDSRGRWRRSSSGTATR